VLTFFRINSIFQVITLLVLFIIIKLPFVGQPFPLLTYELEWMLVGEKLNEGLGLYNEILTQVGPLSGFFYRFVYLWAGKNQFFYETTAMVLIVVQTLYFVFIVNTRNIFNEKNYVSGLFFLILMNASFDIQKLSPALMANMFILIALNVALRQIEKRDGVGDDVFEIGLFLGIATLFHLPSFIFIFWAVFVLFLYTGANVRQIFMVILAFIMPLFFMYLYFYFNHHGSEFLNVWLFNLSNIFDWSLSGFKDILIGFSLTLLVSFLGIFRILKGNRYNSFQNRSHQLLIIFGFFGVLSLLISQNFMPSNFIFIIPYLAFAVSGFFIHSRKTFAPELLVILFCGITLTMQFLGVKGTADGGLMSLVNYRVNEQEIPSKYQNKKVFVTGEHIDAYKSNRMATGYLSWKLAKLDFKNPNNYMSLVNIYNNFLKDMPDIIIDKEKVMPAVFKNIPELGKKYKKSTSFVYVLSN
jgi:hypothetical protein